MTERSHLHMLYEAARHDYDAANERRRAAESALWWAEDDVKQKWDRVQRAYVALSNAIDMEHGENAMGGKDAG
jgi:hypothetical protein